MACLSVAEYLGGGLALATVALIAVSSAHIARPQASVPAVPLRYATAAIETSDAAAKLSLEPPEPNETPGETRNKRVSDQGAAAAAARSIAPDVVSVPPAVPQPSSAAADHPTPLAARWPVELGIDNAARIGQHVLDAGSVERSAGIVSALQSREPPTHAGLAESSQLNRPNPSSVRAAATFVGGWTDDGDRCRPDKKMPLVISPRAAKTAYGECDFGSVARESANRWRVAAICTADGRFWRAHIALKLAEPKLTWSSERGTATYTRCKR